MGYNLSFKKKEILPFATTWINLEGITLSDISQTKKDKFFTYHLHEESKLAKLVKAESGMVVARNKGKEETGRY